MKPGPTGPGRLRRRSLLLSLAVLPHRPALAQPPAPPPVLRVVGSADPRYRLFRRGGATGTYCDLLN